VIGRRGPVPRELAPATSPGLATLRTLLGLRSQHSEALVQKTIPLENRQTEDQAAAFAMEYANKLEFPCKGDKYQALMASIKRFLSQTQGKI
jgi:hypothetical protein